MIEVRELTKNYGDKRAMNRRFGHDVFVRSPRRSGLTRVLTGMGATVLTEPNGGLSVTGIEAWRIASVAAANCIPIQELTPRSVLPEDFCSEHTNTSVKYRVQRQTAGKHNRCGHLQVAEGPQRAVVYLAAATVTVLLAVLIVAALIVRGLTLLDKPGSV